MAREKRVYDFELDYLGPVAIAQFVDQRLIEQWPMAWTKRGLAAIRQGYGRWTGTYQKLLYANGIAEIPGGAAHWDGRTTRLPGT